MYIQTLFPTDAETAVRAAAGRADEPRAPQLPEPLRDLVERIEPDSVRDTMRRIFSDLARLLGHTHWVERALEAGAASAGSLPAFPPVHEEARALLDFIEVRAERVRDWHGELYQALDGTTYALRHELRRVFEHEMVGASTREDGQQGRAHVAHANGLLRNCFQQTVITLAQVFDPALDGLAIFDDCQARLEESVVLCRDLFRLVRLMRSVEAERSRQAIIALVVNLQNFRRGSMRYLMYKDWAEYERLVKAVLSTTSVEELLPVTHQFACYLETLLGHVRMRAVLVNSAFDFSEIECADEEAEAVGVG